jgi:hypothetical protein
MAEKKSISIWFFCGVLTLTYGLVLTAQGVYELNGHAPSTVLAHLQPTLWWGLLMTVAGGGYTVKFRPGKVE